MISSKPAILTGLIHCAKSRKTGLISVRDKPAQFLNIPYQKGTEILAKANALLKVMMPNSGNVKTI